MIEDATMQILNTSHTVATLPCEIISHLFHSQ